MSSRQQIKNDFKIALSWCLAWGRERQPACDRTLLDNLRNALKNGGDVPSHFSEIVQQVEHLQSLDSDQPETLDALKQTVGDIWNQQTPIGLVYGGATKIKQYVFESANLMEIRGASAILDRINLVDLPAFFGQRNLKNDLEDYRTPRNWLESEYPELANALIPELIVYATGGNILAFCPAAYVDDLADAIEKRYTRETLTANSCAVGDSFRLLEVRFGLFQEQLESTPWFDWYCNNANQELVQAYFGAATRDGADIRRDNFFRTKSFNELTRKLAIRFNQRRSGNETPNRRSRRHPPHLETHPYLIRDENDRTSAIDKVEVLPSEPKFSEPLARKYLMGQRTKKESKISELPEWYAHAETLDLTWEPGYVDSWVEKFKNYLNDESNQALKQRYSGNLNLHKISETRNVEEIAHNSNGFLGYIYADGNNMGGYIQGIKTPEAYRQFSEDIFTATEESVYYALAKNLQPETLRNLTKIDNRDREGQIVHPFEIITIGGDDVLIVVPANQALAIAKDIGEKFEQILTETGNYPISEPKKPPKLSPTHRYYPEHAPPSQSSLSTSLGVLITRYDTPIYYADRLVGQLLKSAKKRAKLLKKDASYYGGTVDVLTLKSVTMISSKIEEFRREGLTIDAQPKLKLYATPYTLHELGGLIGTIQSFKRSEFPRSQLYQIRSLLERGKRTAMLNYLYFSVRLKSEKRNFLRKGFEAAWCPPKDPKNHGNLAPWMTTADEDGKTVYETIWRDVVDLYPFIEVEPMPGSSTHTADTEEVAQS